MLEEYFSAPKTLRRLRTGPSAPYIDGFAVTLQENGYSMASAVRYLHETVALGLARYFKRRRRFGTDHDRLFITDAGRTLSAHRISCDLRVKAPVRSLFYRPQTAI